ncbi:MAG: hypothetical protein NTY76_07765 [Candidatus Omnitrophica bacterium]|nr:hypothetical protein [Candidatus Omnitrophota bacterium]
MRKLIIAMLILAGTASFSFADEGEQSAAQEAPKKVIKEVTLRTGSTDFVTGKVDSVMPADLLTRPRAKIVIVDGSGNSQEFAIKTLAVIYDSTGRFLTLSDVHPAQEVQVNYITKADKTREAASIKILK